MHLFDLLQQKYELYCLEKRYTRGRNRRSTFVSEAQYVDGEYIYSPTSKHNTGTSSSDSDDQQSYNTQSPTSPTASRTEYPSIGGRSGKASKRMSLMGMDWRKGAQKEDRDRRLSTLVVSEREVKWDDVRN